MKGARPGRRGKSIGAHGWSTVVLEGREEVDGVAKSSFRVRTLVNSTGTAGEIGEQ